MASSAWEARNARARSLGYRNYYDYRVHGYGADAPDAPAATGERLSRLRGHRSGSDLLSLAKRGEIALALVIPTRKDPESGKISEAAVRVTLDDGSEKEFRLTGQLSDEDWLDEFSDALDDSDTDVVDTYMLIGGE